MLMDSHQLRGYGVTGSTISYSSSSPISPSLQFRHLSSSKLDLRNSPNSSVTTHPDCETTTTTTLSDSQEQHSSQDISPFEATSYLPRASSFDLHQTAWLLQDSNIKRALLQLETALMSPDDDALPPTPRAKRHKTTTTPDLKKLLIACATALDEYDIATFDALIATTRNAVSITGAPIQRLGAYLIEGLVARKESSGANIYRALKRKEPEKKDLLSYMQILYEICPYLKFGYMAANGAIADACKHEQAIHIIDFQIAQGTQWITLLQALAARPCGAPRVRITGLSDPLSTYASFDVSRRLSAVSSKFRIPLEFHPVPASGHHIRREMLRVRPGEALVVNFPLQLHHTPDESVDVSNPRDGLLRLVRSLNPKVITLVEQESNTNTAPFLSRFQEAMEYYLAMFESIDVSLPREQRERIGVEQHCLARDIVNVIACEGRDRAERHELFGKWKSRFTMAGFRQHPLSAYVNTVIKGLLRCYSEHYTLVEKEGAMLLGWKNRNLISASAWCC